MFGRIFGRSESLDLVNTQNSVPTLHLPGQYESFDLQPQNVSTRSSASSISSSSPGELPQQLREILIPASLEPNALNSTCHMRVVVAQDPFCQAVRAPLFDSHPTAENTQTSDLKRGNLNSFPAHATSETDSCSSISPSNGLIPNQHNQPVFPTPSPDAPSFYRLVDYMFGNVPMAYKGTGVKMRPLNVGDSSERLSFLISKLFSISPHDRSRFVYSADSDVPEGLSPYPKIKLNSSSTPFGLHASGSTASALPTECSWDPLPAPGDSLPVPQGKGVFFAIGVVVSVHKDDQYLLTSNWSAFSRSLDEFARVIYAQLQEVLISQHAQTVQCGSPDSTTHLLLQHFRIPPAYLQGNEEVRMSALRFFNRFCDGQSIPRIRSGMGKWDIWAEESRRLDELFTHSNKGLPSFLKRALTSFLGAHLDWLETFGFTKPLLDRHTASIPIRTIVVGDKQTSQRILFLFAAFLRVDDVTPQLKSSQTASLSTSSSIRLARDAWDIPALRHPPRVSSNARMSLNLGSSSTSYISSLWSQPSSIKTPLTAANMFTREVTSSGSSISDSISVSCSSTTAEMDNDADFFGPWEDISGSSPLTMATVNALSGSARFSSADNTLNVAMGSVTMTSYDVKPKFTVPESAPVVMEVAIPARYADLRLPSLSGSIGRIRPYSNVKFDCAPVSMSPTDTMPKNLIGNGNSLFHPEFQIQSCCGPIDDGTLEKCITRSLIEDAEYGGIVLPHPMPEKEFSEWTVVSRALIVDVDHHHIQVWSVVRKFAKDKRSIMQKVVKSEPLVALDGTIDLTNMWTAEESGLEWLSATRSATANSISRERVEKVLHEFVDFAGKSSECLRLALNRVLIGPEYVF
ncbi:hypothetical protein V1512DRAFT_258638 [Lipomyces arxii]|uniref:uncharacterized protein n=1 Tax=Lipomyces arxii TaxID=56418 RepID=UPI0034CE38C2